MANPGPSMGRPPSGDEQMWMDMGKELEKGSIDAVEGMAKNLLTAVGVLEGLYFHAVSFEKVHERVGSIAQWLGTPTWIVALLFGVPAVLWLLSAGAAMLALTVRRHDLQMDVPAELAQQIRGIAAEKYKWARRGIWLLLAGLAVLSVNLIVYLAA